MATSREKNLRGTKGTLLVVYNPVIGQSSFYSTQEGELQWKHLQWDPIQKILRPAEPIPRAKLVEDI